MWIRASGKIGENTAQLTTAVSSHLLVIGDTQAALVDASIAAVGPNLIDEIKQYLTADHVLEYVLLSHAHFDHIGALPQLRKEWPSLKVIASPQCQELLNNKEYLKSLYTKNADCAAAIGFTELQSEAEWLSSFTLERVMSDGDVIMLDGGIEIKMIDCPGHTADSLAFYVRPDCVLASGEALGAYYGRDKLSCCFTSDYKSYLSSLDKFSRLELNFVVLPHGGTLSGDLARKYPMEARIATERFFATVSERLETGEVVDEIAQSLTTEWTFENRAPEGPFVATIGESIHKMVKLVAEAKGKL